MQKFESHINYRADIDGLRAIAILLVVGFHTFPHIIKAGFIGVDVFFVISGYLISTLILADIGQNSFDIFKFYGRRVRRIFPSLIIVLISCSLFGWFSLLADEFKELGKHVAAGSGFVSNFVLWSESSYFDNAAETKILLHLWSLAIEEQFYIFWPLILWLLWKTRFNLLYVALFLILCSFTLNIFEINKDNIEIFYSPLSRFWELLTGAVIAIASYYRASKYLPNNIAAPSSKTPITSKLSNILSCIGITIFAIGLLLINKKNIYPGWWAVFPISAAALIITAGPLAWINRKLFSNKLLVGIGLISYPLYLWHWPILAFANIINGKSPSIPFKIAAIILSILLSWLSYKFIEKPIRKLTGKLRFFATSILVLIMLSIGIIGYVIYLYKGFTFRTEANISAQLTGDIGRDAYLDFIVANFYPCTNIQLRELSVKDTKYGYRCFQSQPTNEIAVLLVGDSHAEHLLPGLAKEFKSNNIASFIQPGLPVDSNEQFSKMFELIKNDKNIHTVIFSAFWMDKIPTNNQKTKDDFVATLNGLKAVNKKIIIMDDVPNFGFDPKNCKFQRMFSFDEKLCEIPVKQNQDNKKISSEVISNVVDRVPDLQYIDLEPYFCDENRCLMTAKRQLLFRDPHHLNIDGSLYLANKIYEKLNDYLKSP